MLQERWAKARFDFGLSDAEFWALTPLKYDLLEERYRLSLAHTEMVNAFTTAAIRNKSVWHQSDPVSPLLYMPNHEDFRMDGVVVHKAEKPMTPEQVKSQTKLQAKVFAIAAEMKRGGGPLLEKISRSERIL